MLQMTDLDQDQDETNGFHYCSKGHFTNSTYQDQFTSDGVVSVAQPVIMPPVGLEELCEVVFLAIPAQVDNE